MQPRLQLVIVIYYWVMYAMYAMYAMSDNVLTVEVKRKLVDDDEGYGAAHDATTTPTGDCHLLLGYVCYVCYVSYVCYIW
jgi:hypothetical protein